MAMFKVKIAVVLIWNLAWSTFAFEQLHLSYDLYMFHASNDNSILATLETQLSPGSHESTDDEKKYTERCFVDSVWSGKLSHEFDFSTSTLLLEYSGNLKELRDVSKLTVKQEPKIYHNNSAGFNYLNYKIIEFEFDQNGKAFIPITASKSKFDVDYPIDLTFEAFGGSNRNSYLCNTTPLARIHKNNYSNYLKPSAYFADNTLSKTNITNYSDIHNFVDELSYIEEFMNKQKMNKLYKNLPPITESTVALLQASVDSDDDDWPWMIKRQIMIPRITEEIVIGFYGDVVEEDLIHLERMLNTLRIVAPALKISYSTNTDLVTLPIHFNECTEEFSELFNYCFDNAWGYYHFPHSSKAQHGWIWIDSFLSKETRQSVITHEIGHALGLDHNLCIDSVMSYSEFSDSKQNYFSHVDLMQLQAIYDPTLITYKNMISKPDLIEHYGLSEEKINEFTDDISNACHKYPGKYDYLISMQIENLEGVDWKTES